MRPGSAENPAYCSYVRNLTLLVLTLSLLRLGVFLTELLQLLVLDRLGLRLRTRLGLSHTIKLVSGWVREGAHCEAAAVTAHLMSFG